MKNITLPSKQNHLVSFVSTICLPAADDSMISNFPAVLTKLYPAISYPWKILTPGTTP